MQTLINAAALIVAIGFSIQFLEPVIGLEPATLVSIAAGAAAAWFIGRRRRASKS